MFDFKQKECCMEKYLKVLRACPLFAGLEDNEILSVLHCIGAYSVSKKQNSYIFRVGDPTEFTGMILSGSALIIQEDLWGIFYPNAM